MAKDLERLSRVRHSLASKGLDAIVCRRPENLVLLAGYWPVIGYSAVIVPREGEPALFAPGMEQEALDRATVSDLRTFSVWHVEDPSPSQALSRAMAAYVREHDLGRSTARIAYDGWTGPGWEDFTPTQKLMEPWAPGAVAAADVQAAFADAALEDAGAFIAQVRAAKTPFELERLTVTNEIAAFGLQAFSNAVRPGQTEVEIGAEVERAIETRGAGYKGTRHARAQTLVFSGRERLSRYSWGYAASTDRRLEEGDVAMLELAVIADGYCTDLTRVRVAGKASQEVRDAWDAVVAAQAAAIDCLVPGNRWADVDAAARASLKTRGLDQAFVHHVGHGVGFRYHEAVPFLHPHANGELAEGMVTTVEPGIYGEKIGGYRLEDALVVTPAGGRLLSLHSHALEG